MQLITWLFHTPTGISIVKGAISGFGPALAIDLHTFAGYKKWNDLTQWDWNTATFRWVMGIIIGGLTGAGLGWMVG